MTKYYMTTVYVNTVYYAIHNDELYFCNYWTTNNFYQISGWQKATNTLVSAVINSDKTTEITAKYLKLHRVESFTP